MTFEHAADEQYPDAPVIGSVEDLLEIGDRLLGSVRPGEHLEVALGRGNSTTVRVHDAEVESLTSAGSSGAGIRVVRDGRLGFAHCGSLDADVLAETLAEARDNCRFSEPDEHNGLADPDGVESVPQDLFSEEVLALEVTKKVDLALTLERLVLGVDPRVASARTTSYGDGWRQSAIVSTQGIRVGSQESSCSIATQPLARADGETQIGWGVDAARRPELLDADRVAQEASERATKLLGATKPASARLSIVLDPRLAITLLGIVAGMCSAESVQKGRSPFADRLGEQVAAPMVNLIDDPTRGESLAADEFDGEGLACRPNTLLVDGVLQRFLYDSTTARRAATTSTGSAVRSLRGLPGPGSQLLVMDPGDTPVAEMLHGVQLGLAVESFVGLHSGVNPTSGDFSVGANGLMIRDGELAEPVQELTIASTIQRLLAEVVAVGSDFEWLPSGAGACSMRIDGVSISGS